MSNNTKTWSVNLLASAESYRTGESDTLSVTISEDAVPTTIGPDGREELDYGNADWPTLGEVNAEAARLIGKTVLTRFVDKGDSLAEAIYSVKPAY